jgi:hypothetical protein
LLFVYNRMCVYIYKTPWPESASELYRPSDRRLSAKLVLTFADIVCHVVSVTDPYDRILSQNAMGNWSQSSSVSEHECLQATSIAFFALETPIINMLKRSCIPRKQQFHCYCWQCSLQTGSILAGWAGTVSTTRKTIPMVHFLEKTIMMKIIMSI